MHSFPSLFCLSFRFIVARKVKVLRKTVSQECRKSWKKDMLENKEGKNKVSRWKDYDNRFAHKHFNIIITQHFFSPALQLVENVFFFRGVGKTLYLSFVLATIIMKLDLCVDFVCSGALADERYSITLICFCFVYRRRWAVEVNK